jgi:hypothetical protein
MDGRQERCKLIRFLFRSPAWGHSSRFRVWYGGGMKMPWWIAEMQVAAARKALSPEQRRAANVATAIGVVLLGCIMVPLDIALGWAGSGDIAAGGISAGAQPCPVLPSLT